MGDWIFLAVEAWFRECEILASVFGCFLHVFISFEVDNDHADHHNCENSCASDDAKDDEVNFVFCLCWFDCNRIRSSGKRREELSKIIHWSDSEVDFLGGSQMVNRGGWRAIQLWWIEKGPHVFGKARNKSSDLNTFLCLKKICVKLRDIRLIYKYSEGNDTE